MINSCADALATCYENLLVRLASPRGAALRLQYLEAQAQGQVHAQVAPETNKIVYDPQETIIAVFSRWDGTMSERHATSATLSRPSTPAHTGCGFVRSATCASQAHILDHPVLPLSPVLFHRYVGALPPRLYGGRRTPASLLIFLVVFYNGNCYNASMSYGSSLQNSSWMVHEWVVQTSFIYDEMETNELDPVLVTNKWRAARRVLASLHLLFMALDAEVEATDNLGRTVKLPNHLDGDGVDDDEYTVIRLNLLTPAEVEEIQCFHGLKSLVPIKWALMSCADCSRMTA